MRTPPIRPATLDDAPELARLISTLGYPFSVEELLHRWAPWQAEGNSALVADGEDGALLGAVTLHRMHVLHRPAPVGRITSMVVDQRARGRGIGRALLAAAEEAARAAGCTLIEVTSNETRFADAHTFYEHLGYERTSVRFGKRLG